jgi:hypothetical protein
MLRSHATAAKDVEEAAKPMTAAPLFKTLAEMTETSR